jgi:hypothetical protein
LPSIRKSSWPSFAPSLAFFGFVCSVAATAANSKGSGDGARDAHLLSFQLLFGEAQDVAAGLPKIEIAAVIGTEGLLPAVIAITVRFHGDVLRPPQEVDEMAADSNVHLGLG